MKAKFSAISISASSPDGDDAPYLEWHQLDHMPQQYEIDGVLYGQRWVSTPECRAARAVESARFAPANHVVQYFFGDPVAQAVDDWFSLGAHLHRVGRFPVRLPAVMLGGFEVASSHAAPSALVTDDVVPYRPNRGVYLVIERPDQAGAPVPWPDDDVERLLALDGVAGLWTFLASALRPDRFDQSGFAAAVCYLDGDPVALADPVGALLAERWSRAPVAPELAAPFVSLRPFEWQRHSQPGQPDGR